MRRQFPGRGAESGGEYEGKNEEQKTELYYFFSC